MINGISRQTLKRLPLYYEYLRGLSNREGYISSAKIAIDLELNPVLVRKDLAAAGASGKPKTGHEIESLINMLEIFLGYRNIRGAMLVGAGKLGQALLDYQGFQAYGIEISLAFDKEESLWDDKRIFPLSKMEDLCRRMGIQIGVITVPAEHAQEVCDLMVKAGIKAIWNFAPVNLKVNSDVYIYNENLSVSLLLLSNQIKEMDN